MDNLHDICITYIRRRGFTFGFRDIDVPAKQREEFAAIVKEAEKSVEEYLQRVIDPNGQVKESPAEIEAVINQKLNQVLSKAAKKVLPTLPRTNLTIMAQESGSRGKPSNITQLSAYVGQQNVYGQRIPCGLINRTVPHFKRGDIFGLKSRGFVSNPYVKGLGMQYLFDL